MGELDQRPDARLVVAPGFEGSALLALFMTPVAALGGLGVGLLMSLVLDPDAAVLCAIVLALTVTLWRISRVRVLVGNDEVEIRNLFTERHVMRQDIRSVSGGRFSGGGRPVPVLVLVTRSNGRMKLLATVRGRQSARAALGRLFRSVAPTDEDFVRYMEY